MHTTNNIGNIYFCGSIYLWWTKYWPSRMFSSQFLDSVNIILYGKRDFAAVIKLKIFLRETHAG
jgi:hypothetical protein